MTGHPTVTTRPVWSNAMTPMFARSRRCVVVIASLVTLAACGSDAASTSAPGRPSSPRSADAALDRAVHRIVDRRTGPPGIAVVVQRGGASRFLTAGVADTTSKAPIAVDDYLRIASVSKAFNGAAVLSTVSSGALALSDTIGARLPDLPTAWSKVTLAQLLRHTSGIPDFSQSAGFRDALLASFQAAPVPRELVAFVESEPLEFQPGTKYRYSNSDNAIAALMVEAATGSTYTDVLTEQVYRPLELTQTSLPSDSALPVPTVHGYDLNPPDPPDDVTNLFAAGWAWASGGMVSSPADANRFVRGYVRGALVDRSTRTAQFRFRPGNSEPRGPGTNSSGLALFRYVTRCGTVYGHTGNTPGYTQFIAANRTGTRSVAVSVNTQLSPRNHPVTFTALRDIYELAVCSALA